MMVRLVLHTSAIRIGVESVLMPEDVYLYAIASPLGILFDRVEQLGKFTVAVYSLGLATAPATITVTSA